MEIYCEINLHKPPSGAFVGVRGNVISGIIKYSVNYPTTITAITASIKGSGTLQIDYFQHDNKDTPEREVFNETYIDVDFVTLSYHKGTVLQVGAYEMPFSLVIPHDIPPSFKNKKYGNLHNIQCNISYYVRVKFSKFGLMAFAKRFRKDIIIISGLVPRLSMSPTVYGGDKKLTQLFSSKQSIIKVKAIIQNSVLKCGDQIKFDYEVINDSNVVIKAVKVKVIEVLTFSPLTESYNGCVVIEENVPNTDTKFEGIEREKSQNMSISINLPSDCESLEFSKIVSKEFFVVLKVQLPMPHRNYELKIPFQVGNIPQDSMQTGFYMDNQPPSYWEAMYEDVGEKDNVLVKE